jgi:uncharacterized membrane protein
VHLILLCFFAAISIIAVYSADPSYLLTLNLLVITVFSFFIVTGNIVMKLDKKSANNET